LERKCREKGIFLILDEVQSGYGRTGKFFAHQHAGVKPHLITMAKGMGNGFPVGGLLIDPTIKPEMGMLGTTFGGNYLAMAASLAVLEVMVEEKLMENASTIGDFIINKLKTFPQIKGVRGRGLMIGFDVPEDKLDIRKNLLTRHKIFTGEAKPNTIRLLPSLAVKKDEIDWFFHALSKELV